METLLFVKSCFSLLDSLLKPSEIVNFAVNEGYKNIGIMDDTLSYAPLFKKEALKANIRPLFLLSFTMQSDNGRLYHPVLMAKNDDGYASLIKLSSFLETEERILKEKDLANYLNNNYLFFFSDDTPLFECDINALNDEYINFKQHFPLAIFALSDHDRAINRQRDNIIENFLKKNNERAVAASRSYYAKADDSYAYMILKGIKDKKTVMDHDLYEEKGRYLKTKAELANLYSSDSLVYSDQLANSCNVNLAFKTTLPDYKTVNNYDAGQYLSALCLAGLKKRLHGHENELYKKRLLNELNIIKKMGFTNYFLIVYDYVCFAKKRGILVGPGRGSAAGSLTAYCLGITEIDPIRYGLIFERFLNPERISMPDIDIDFPDDRRDEVINYVKEKYGVKHVAHIITYGTLKARQVVRDVGRVLNYPLYEIDSITKLIPSDPKITLYKAYETSLSFKRKIDSQDRFRRLFEICLKLENLPRHASTHAAGIVMSEKELTAVIPIEKIEDDLYSVQYTNEYLEEMGLIKMDFLGLRNLSIIAEIIEDIKLEKKDFRISMIPLNDPKTFDNIAKGNTLGIFQLESAGMTNLIKKVKPKSYEEIASVIALFRPGPMDNIDDFINNRNNPASIHYLHKDLKPILEETYGIIVYQEQIMNIARIMAGFSYAKADILRKAMSKKKEKELYSLHDDFIAGALSKGYPRKTTEEVYNLILKFANYGFNKSHSYAYALISYQMAYLKANYPLQFYKALLNGSIGSELKTYEYIKEIKRSAITILKPDILKPDYYYKIENNSIRMPLSIIKEVGFSSIKTIIEEEKEKIFKDYEDTLYRLQKKSIAKNVLINLIKAGAFDSFEYNRLTMLNNLDIVLLYVKELGGLSLFDDSFDTRPQLTKYADNNIQLANYEHEVLGFYFSYNPLEEIKNKYKLNCPELIYLNRINSNIEGFGHIDRLKQHRTKNNKLMAFVDISDDTGSFDLVIMPNLYQVNQDKLKKGLFIHFKGRIEKENSCLVSWFEVLV